MLALNLIGWFAGKVVAALGSIVPLLLCTKADVCDRRLLAGSPPADLDSACAKQEAIGGLALRASGSHAPLQGMARK